MSFQRLTRMLAEVFGVVISAGAIANILARAQTPLQAATIPMAEAVRQSPVVGSDETAARVCGKTWWQWVLLSSTAICPVIADTRAAAVVSGFLAGARPEVWVANVYAAAATVIATSRLHGLTALEALRAALAGVPIMRSG